MLLSRKLRHTSGSSAARISWRGVLSNQLRKYRHAAGSPMRSSHLVQVSVNASSISPIRLTPSPFQSA